MFSVLLFKTAAADAQSAHITIDAAKVLNKVPATLYGSCIEDVNHEVYGGIYGERIYGGNFEEPALAHAFKGWANLQGEWRIGGGGAGSAAGPGYTILRNGVQTNNGSIEADIAFTDRGRDAGLLFRVTKATPGSPYFNGYRVSCSKGQRRIRLEKFNGRPALVDESAEDIDIKNEVHLKIKATGNHISVYVNSSETPVIDYSDKTPLPAGSVGLYTNNAAASFQNIAIDADGNKSKEASLTPVTALQVSFQWKPVGPVAAVKYSLDSADAVSGRQAQVIEALTANSKAGISNAGLNHWGISIKKGQRYPGFVYLKAQGYSGTVMVTLESDDAKTIYAKATISGVSSAWKKYSFSLQTTGSTARGNLVIRLLGKGKLLIDRASLSGAPQDEFKGLNLRADIAGMMQKEGLSFLRYGGTMVNAKEYNWKNMTGPQSLRPPYRGHWYPWSNNGFGFEEFLQLCEAAGFTSAFAVNTEDSAEDIANMVEYLTADKSTAWGAKRAAVGHPKPYPVKYIEIGNEEVIWGDKKEDYEHYAQRFNILYDAIHAKNPAIKVVCAAWWRPKSPNMEIVFKAINGRADYWDLHTDADEAAAGTTVDKNIQHMHDLFLQWDPATKMKCAVFEENGGLHNMQRALGHATTLNAIRRHGDFVLTSCPANALQPYLQNDNDWDQGQIFFTPDKVWGMPPFYVQQMASANHQRLRIAETVEGPLDVSATRSDDGKELVLHIVNTGKSEVTSALDITNFKATGQVAVTTISAPPSAENTLEEPSRVSPLSKVISLQKEYTFLPNSYTIMRFKR
ncbi:hypothetical protein BC343_13095 [Mucilaginibacter pedocola]|uniref:non-reducing end alpha-L-arabinofuranosidase n=1 Tax=Mucilaginibacter pedocola TaxID=1792845 RepID=A0A1S9PA97_9SPHI|nr:hypothetical protein BC343_13095 [Mucilaginibacter pedocola]